MVVLDHHEVVACGHRQQFLAALQRHGHGCGALVAGRHIDIVAARHGRPRNQPLPVHGQRQHMARAQGKGVACVRVTGVLHAHPGGRTHQQHGQQKGRLLRAVGDQDLIALGPDSARRQQPAVDLIDQRLVVTVYVVARPLAHRARLQRLQRAGAPVTKREQAGIELAVDERIRLLLPVRRLADVALCRGVQLQAFRPGLGAVQWRRVRSTAPARQRSLLGTGNEVPAARPADDQSLVGQRLQGQGHGGS